MLPLKRNGLPHPDHGMSSASHTARDACDGIRSFGLVRRLPCRKTPQATSCRKTSTTPPHCGQSNSNRSGFSMIIVTSQGYTRFGFVEPVPELPFDSMMVVCGFDGFGGGDGVDGIDTVDEGGMILCLWEHKNGFGFGCTWAGRGFGRRR